MTFGCNRHGVNGCPQCEDKPKEPRTVLEYFEDSEHGKLLLEDLRTNLEVMGCDDPQLMAGLMRVNLIVIRQFSQVAQEQARKEAIEECLSSVRKSQFFWSRKELADLSIKIITDHYEKPIRDLLGEKK